MDLNNSHQITPLSFGFITYLWVLGFSAWGGVVNYYRKYRCDEIKKFSWVEMSAEVSTASFAGVLTFLCCEAAHFTQLFTAVMVGVSGHMGSRSVAFFEHMLQEKLFKHNKQESQNQQYYQPQTSPPANFNLNLQKERTKNE